MMEPALAILAAGFLLGLAGSLHCACMCGGIASGALFILRPATPRQRLASLMLLQSGRVITYAAAGGSIAGLSSLTVDPGSSAITFRVLQWVGAAALMWIGLATAGMLPRLAIPNIGTVPIATFVDPLLSPLRRNAQLGPLALGVSWGLAPCPMVYAALVSAALTGSTIHGALWMLAFGTGTLPGVIGAALGVSMLTRVKRGIAAEALAGTLITAFGFFTLYFDWPSPALLCVSR